MAKGKKTGGRVAGTPNKKAKPLIELAKTLNIDPFEVLLRFAAEDWEGLGYPARTKTSWTNAGIEFEEYIIKPEMRVKAASEACQYIHAKRKSIESTVDPALLDQMRAWEDMPTEELRAIFKNMMEGNALEHKK